MSLKKLTWFYLDMHKNKKVIVIEFGKSLVWGEIRLRSLRSLLPFENVMVLTRNDLIDGLQGYCVFGLSINFF